MYSLPYTVKGKKFPLFSKMSQPVVGPTQSPSQWVPAVLSMGVNRPGGEGDRSPPSSAKDKN